VTQLYEAGIEGAMDSSVPAVSVRNVWKRYESVDVLRDVSVDFRPGQVHAIVGENGAGKSTLVKIVAGETQPTRGRVLVHGEEVHLRSPADGIAAGIACVYQELTLLDNLSIPENVLLGIEPRRGGGILRRDALEATASRRLAEVGLQGLESEHVGQLPVGLQSLIEVAKWGARAGSVLILDEPTSALRSDESELLFEAVESLRASGVALIYISHRLGEVVRLADVATVLRDGEVAGVLERGSIDEDALIALMVGGGRSRRERQRPIEAAGQSVPDALTVEGLSGARFSDVSLSVRPGTILGIAGQVGSGVEELSETIAGWRKPTRGAVRCRGKRCPPGSLRKARQLGLVFLPADRKVDGLAQSRPASENVAAGIRSRRSRVGVISASAERAAVEAAARSARLGPELLERDVLRMSGGQQQKVLLAQCLAAQPDVLVVVEPTRGVDVAAREEIHAAIRDSCRERNLAVVVASSDSAELVDLCDKIAVMRSGRVTELLDAHEMTRESLLAAMSRPYATSGSDVPAEDAKRLAPERTTGDLPVGTSDPQAQEPPDTPSGQSAPSDLPRRVLAAPGLRVPLSGSSALALPALLGAVAIAIALSFASPYFLTSSNLGNLGREVVVLGLASLGEMLVILLAGIDLSIGAVITLTNLVSSSLLLQMSPAAAVPLSLCVGAASGALCGAGVVLGLPSFLVTYAISLIEGGVALFWFAHSVGPVPKSFWRLASASLGPIPVATIGLLVVVVLLFSFLRSTALGRHWFAVGRDVVCSRRSGLSVRWIIFLPYLLSGILAAAAGIFLTARVGGGLPGSGTNVTLDAIAAVMLGGASFFGGRISVVGTIFGVVVLTLVGNGLDLLHVNGFLNEVVLGVIVLLVVGSWSVARRPRRGERVV